MSKIKLLVLTFLLIFTALSLYAKDVKGNVDNIDLKNKKITIYVNGTQETYQVTAASKLYRSLINTPPLDVDLLSISPGDAIECSVDDKGVITKATASFNIIRGTIAKIDNNVITMADGKNVKIASKASISLENGNIGKVSDLVPGHTFVSRTNPNTGDIWTLVVSGKVAPPKVPTVKPNTTTKTTTSANPPKPQTPVKEPVKPEPVKPQVPSQNVAPSEDLQITSVEISAPKTFVSGDLLLVKVVGSPHCGVSSELQYIAGTKVKLTEDTPGVYTGFITVPSRDLTYAKFIAYMSANNKNISKISDTVLHVSNKTGKLQTIVKNDNTKPAEKTEPKQEENNVKGENSVKEGNNENTNTEITTTESTEPSSENNNNENTEIETKSSTTEGEDNNTNEEKKVEKKESEQITDTKDVADQNTNKDTIIDPLKESATIKVDEIKIVTPQNDAVVQNIEVSGLAIPDKNILVKTIYTNGKNGVLSIKGILHEETIKVNSEGVFNYGPLQLDGFFATPGLQYYIEFKYADDDTFAPKVIRVFRQ